MKLVTFGPVVSLFSSVALASSSQFYGSGSRAQGLANSLSSTGSAGFRAAQNPAVGRLKETLEFGWGISRIQPSMRAIPSVIVENLENSDRVRTGSVDTSYPSALAQTLGLTFQSQESLLHPTLSFAAILPIDTLAVLDSGEILLPEYVLYRARLQRPEFHLSGALNVWRDLWVGLGVQLGTTLTSRTDVFLQTAANAPSSMRIRGTLKTRAAPTFGIQFKNSSNEELLQTLGVVYRHRLAQPGTFQVQSSARALGSLAALDLQFQALNTLFYDPDRLLLGAELLAGDFRFHPQLGLERWSALPPPGLRIQSVTGFSVNPSSSGIQATQDILIPSIGVEWLPSELPLWAFRMGFEHRSSIFLSLPTDSLNLIDPEKSSVTWGLGYTWRQCGWLSKSLGTCSLDAHGMLQTFRETRVQKAQPQNLGAPGYEIGGKVWGFGISLSFGVL